MGHLSFRTDDEARWAGVGERHPTQRQGPNFWSWSSHTNDPDRAFVRPAIIRANRLSDVRNMRHHNAAITITCIERELSSSLERELSSSLPR